MSYDDGWEVRSKKVGNLELTASIGIYRTDDDNPDEESSRNWDLELTEWNGDDGNIIWKREYYSETDLIKGFNDNLYRIGTSKPKPQIKPQVKPRRITHKMAVLNYLIKRPNTNRKELERELRIGRMSMDPVIYGLLDAGKIKRIKRGRSFYYSVR